MAAAAAATQSSPKKRIALALIGICGGIVGGSVTYAETDNTWTGLIVGAAGGLIIIGIVRGFYESCKCDPMPPRPTTDLTEIVVYNPPDPITGAPKDPPLPPPQPLSSPPAPDDDPVNSL
jgi:hypothetical protein